MNARRRLDPKLVLALLAALSSPAACSKGERAGEPTTASSAASASASAEAPSSDLATAATASAESSPSASASTTSEAPSAAAASASAAPTACGERGQPKCPLQGWMSKVMQPAMASKDPAKVAAALRASAKYGPPELVNWAKMANEGAAAVEAAKDVAAGKKSCSECHKAYKAKYKAEFRTRPI